MILAESSHFVASDNQVTAALPTTNNEWEMTVTYCGGSNCVGWYPYAIFASTILSLCISFLVYTIFVQKQIHNDALAEKQRTLTENAKKAARVERDLNDFIAHEVRNPLAAALSACSFVNASVNEPNPLQDEEARQSVRGDVRIIENALGFINDLLRSMLDLHRARSKQMILEFLPTDLKRDIFDPVASLLYRRDESFDVLVECSDDLVVNVDRLRLKQIVLNLARNSAKFVTKGFVRLRAENVGDGNLYIYVEDSGPGIPEEKKDELFGKFQESLDALSQGTGIGLSLCKKLIDLMDGRIKLDHNYHSGVEGRPGARFCIQFPCEFLSLDMVSLMSTDHRSCDFANESSLEDSDRHEGPCDPTTRRKKNNNNTANDNTVLADIEVGSNPGGSNKEEEEEDGNQIKVLPDGLSVLFVDDDMVLRKLFARSIRRACPTWNVQEASNGETALVLAGNENFDVIFVDQYMTSVDKQLLGTETTRMLRANGMKGIICGLSANEMEAPFLTAGADSFMLKPFQCKPEPLAQELLRVFNKRPYS